MLISRRIVTQVDGQRMMLLIARDVSALRRQTRVIEGQQQLTRAVIDSEDHFVFVKDAELRYVLVNQAYARCVRSSPEAMVGRTPQELFPGKPVTDRVLQADREVLSTGRDVTQEDVIDFGDGPRQYLAHKQPLTLADGQRGVLAVIRDVTEERERACWPTSATRSVRPSTASWA